MPALRHFIEALFNPMMIIFAFLLCLYVLVCKERGSKFLRFFVLFTIIIFYFLSSGFIARLWTSHVEAKIPPVLTVDQNIHFVVVLGGGHARGDAPANDLLSSASLSRFMEGLRLYRMLSKAQLILSGGAYDTIQSEAEHMAELASWCGVAPADIRLERDSINTAEQAVALQTMLKDAPFYLVTSASHMPRALALFQALHMNAIPAPTDFTYYWQDERWEKTVFPNAKNMVYLSIAWRELLGSTWARLSY